MHQEVSQFLATYLLMPILAVVLGVVVMLIAKKNKLLSNKKAIFYFLVTWILLALPALLGFVNFWFMPYNYIGLLVLYLILGYFNLGILYHYIPAMKDKAYWVEFSLVFVSFLIGAGLFSMVFNLCNDLQYGIWASTCMLTFVFASLYKKMYQTFMLIPLEVYKIWEYDRNVKIIKENMENDILVVELELFKQIEDNEPLNIKAKAPENMSFGNWFQLFVEDYNQKNPTSSITPVDDAGSYGWLFYTNSFFLGIQRHVDPELSFAQNKIKENRVISAKRAQYELGTENTIHNEQDIFSADVLNEDQEKYS